MKSTTIRERLLWGFVLIALVPLLGVGLATSLVSYYNGREQSVDRLDSVAARKELAIRTWAQSLQQELQVVSQTDYSPRLVGTALRLANEDKRYPWFNTLVRKRLQALVDKSSQFDELFLLDLGGRVVVSTDQSREGKRYGDTADFRPALAGPLTRLPFDPTGARRRSIVESQSEVISLVPHREEGREVTGIIAGRSRVDKLSAILSERTGLGQTGKAFLVDGNQMLLEGIPLHTSGLDAAIQSAGSNSGVYVGSGGVSVVGSSRWLPDLQVALSVEQHLSEALRAVFATLGIHAIIALIAVAIAVIASLMMARSIADPIAGLARTASQIARGNLDRSVEGASTQLTRKPDEIGALAASFNSMTVQLRDLINSLERRVDDRTRALQEANEALERRALQLETSARVGRDITSILDLDVLLARVVDLIQDAFGYYHVQVFLLDRDAGQLVLRAGGRTLSAEYRRLAMEQASINTRAAQSGQPVLVNDVTREPTYLFDSNLPGTRSELVVPLRLGEQVIGTLDVHNARPDGFSSEDVLVIRSLGDQIAVAIENAYLYDQSRELAVLEERNRLARELHDSVTQSIYSVVLLSEGWRRLLSTGTAGAQPEIQFGRIGEIAQQALKEMRLLIHELRPPAVDQEGLVDALRKRLDAVENRVGIEGRVVMEDFIDLPAGVAEGLYRIAQEALNNALKHARATRETVRLFRREDTVVLEISDDGVGFDLASVEGKGGMGLTNMRERTNQLAGELTIQSVPGLGTTVTVSVPLRNAAWREVQKAELAPMPSAPISSAPVSSADFVG